MKARITVILLTGLGLVAVWMWAGGCDFSRVGDDAEVSIVKIVSDLSKANSEAKAAKAIRTLVKKTRMGEPGEANPLEAYELDEDDIEVLAELQSASLQGSGTSGLTAADVYEAALQSGDTVTADLATVLRSLEERLGAAVNDPEEPMNALIVALASRDGRLPQPSEPLRSDDVLTPVQRMLFSAFIHDTFEDRDVSFSHVAPDGTRPRHLPRACLRKCAKKLAFHITNCRTEFAHDPENMARCIEIHTRKHENCVDRCFKPPQFDRPPHDQGGGQ